MFVKPYKIKSTSTLKNTEKKQLVQRVQEAFPAASEDEIKELIPTKCACSCFKLVVHSGECVSLYAVEGVPMMLERASGLLPAPPALWKVPKLLPLITVHTPVLAKLAAGAPLYLPGVVISSGGVGFPMFAAGAPLAARTVDNGAAAVVGYATMGSADMLLRAQGNCMEVVFVCGDQLSREPKLTRAARPMVPIGQGLEQTVQQLTIKEPAEQWPALGAPPAPANTPRIPESAPAGPNGDEPSLQIQNIDSPEVPPSMDELLRHCLLSFLALRAKSVTLPLKVNLLYKNHLIPLCPAGHTLDVKQSSYKKIGKFLDNMQQEGLLEIRETDKGVWDVTAVNIAHPAVKSHKVTASDVTVTAPAPGPEVEYTPPAIKEVYCVTAAVQDLLNTKKGTPLTSREIRSLVTAYVQANRLTAANGRLCADSRLAALLHSPPDPPQVTWEQVMSAVLAKMTPATLITQGDDCPDKLIKSRLDPVTMSVVTRSGNKKVTLVSNLESFGLSPSRLAKTAQAACGASCGVTRSPGAKADQLMLQGDQTTFVARLLIEKYGLPKKFLEGADKALNKKK